MGRLWLLLESPTFPNPVSFQDHQIVFSQTPDHRLDHLPHLSGDQGLIINLKTGRNSDDPVLHQILVTLVQQPSMVAQALSHTCSDRALTSSQGSPFVPQTILIFTKLFFTLS